MNIIYERTGVRYHEVHVYRLLHKWGVKPKVPQRRFINLVSEGITKFRKLILFLDRAAQYYRSSKVRKHLEERKGVIRVEYLPKGSPGLSAVEECWRKGKDDLLVSSYYSKFRNLKTIAVFSIVKKTELERIYPLTGENIPQRSRPP